MILTAGLASASAAIPRCSRISGNAIRLAVWRWGQWGDRDVDGGWVGAAVDVAGLGAVLRYGAFGGPGVSSGAPVGQEGVEDGGPDAADQVDLGAGGDGGGSDDLVAGGVERDAEAGPVGIDVGVGGGSRRPSRCAGSGRWSVGTRSPGPRRRGTGRAALCRPGSWTSARGRRSRSPSVRGRA